MLVDVCFRERLIGQRVERLEPEKYITFDIIDYIQYVVDDFQILRVLFHCIIHVYELQLSAEAMIMHAI